jgi:CDP-paratose 2-epimerase
MTEDFRGQKAQGPGASTEAGKVPALLRLPSSGLRLLSPGPCTPLFGMTGHFPPGAQERVEAGMRALASLGVRHIRIEIDWADWQETGVREWYQRLMGSLSQQFTVLPALVYAPPSAEMRAGPQGNNSAPGRGSPTHDSALGAPSPAPASLPPEDPKAFADFVDVLTDGLPGPLEWIELPSEPAHPGIWDWRLDPRGHIFSQVIASAAYRCRQRGIKTVLGGLRTGDLGWLSLLCENGVVDFADAVGLQDDPAAPLIRARGWPEVVRDAKRILAEHCRNAQLWITGAGCSTDNYDEFAQCEAFVGLLNSDAQRIYWSDLQDAPLPSPRRADRGDRALSRHPGLLRSDGTPKLLFRLWKSQGIEGIRQITDCVSTRQSKLRPVLITGGAGFIGSNLAERLLRQGRPVMILDNLSRIGVEHNVKYLWDIYGDLLEVHVGDVRNQPLVEKLAARCAAIFHFAAQVAVTTSLADPASDFETNLQGTLNVLEAARKQEPLPPVLFTSTHNVYGDLRDVELIPRGKRHVPRDHGTRMSGISETRPLDFHSPYGCSKGAADQYVLDYARMYGLPGVVFRMSCIYGRRQLGTEDQGWVAHFALQMLRDGPLTLYGDGRQVRDILYIDDLLDAMLLAMEHIREVAGKAFNIGGGPGNTVSVLEVIERLSELSGVQPEIRYGPRRQGDPSYYVSDIRRFARATGWTPRVPARRGVPRLYHWILENVRPGVLQPQE